ncbi:hypothetical protein [Pseudoroseicyclus sp. CXY001]|uniref:hypothetical protein n=1 Tax=Pseudoroseicyclus sp. CXY001 TaxID=3242492 RepID=UPI0035714758
MPPFPTRAAALALLALAALPAQAQEGPYAEAAGIYYASPNPPAMCAILPWLFTADGQLLERSFDGAGYTATAGSFCMPGEGGDACFGGEIVDGALVVPRADGGAPRRTLFVDPSGVLILDASANVPTALTRCPADIPPILPGIGIEALLAAPPPASVDLTALAVPVTDGARGWNELGEPGFPFAGLWGQLPGDEVTRAAVRPGPEADEKQLELAAVYVEDACINRRVEFSDRGRLTQFRAGTNAERVAMMSACTLGEDGLTCTEGVRRSDEWLPDPEGEVRRYEVSREGEDVLLCVAGEAACYMLIPCEAPAE